jgi:hypothetical protein
MAEPAASHAMGRKNIHWAGDRFGNIYTVTSVP